MREHRLPIRWSIPVREARNRSCGSGGVAARTAPPGATARADFARFREFVGHEGRIE